MARAYDLEVGTVEVKWTLPHRMTIAAAAVGTHRKLDSSAEEEDDSDSSAEGPDKREKVHEVVAVVQATHSDFRILEKALGTRTSPELGSDLDLECAIGMAVAMIPGLAVVD